jgi:hypothetical protein
MASLPPPSPSAPPGPEPAEGHDAAIGASAGTEVGASAGTAVGNPVGTAVDLDRIAQDLADVEVALDRLDQGTYWTCEVTGEPLPDDLLAADPVARRRPPADGSSTAPASPGSTMTTW